MWEIWFTIILLVLILVMFSFELFSVDIITGIVISILLLSGIITPGEAYDGFSRDYVVIIASVFVITGAIENSGILQYAIEKFFNIKDIGFNTLMIFIILIASLITAPLSNTTSAALLINPIILISRKLKVSPSKYLMPMAFATIAGGNIMLIGTSTNIAASGYMTKVGLEPVGMFEIWHIGLIATGMLILYMITIGKYLLPSRTDVRFMEEEGIRKYVSEIIVKPESKLVGKTVEESDFKKMGLKILNQIRNGIVFQRPNGIIRENDSFIVYGKPEILLKFKDMDGLEIKSDIYKEDDKKGSKFKLAEILIPAKSDLLWTTIGEAYFQQRFGLNVIAINRAGHSFREHITDIELQVGDLLLIHGPEENFKYLYKNRNVTILEEHEGESVSLKRGIFILCSFLIAVIASSFNLLPTDVCFVLAAVVTLLFKGISTEKAYRVIDWRLLILIGGMTALGTAMEKTGTDIFLAHELVELLADFGPHLILGGFMLLAILLTQPLSNAAAALVILPIAIKTATELGLNERSYAIGVMLAASVSLIAPLEPACVLVYAPGNYKFFDFVKVGGLLTLSLFFLLYFLVPVFWPFN